MNKIASILYSMLIFIFIFILFLPLNICVASVENKVNQIETEIIDESIMEPEWLEPSTDKNEQLNAENNSNRSRGKGRSLLGSYKGLTYYSQADKRWANKFYTSTNNLNQTMKSSGCGPTAAAIVVSSSIGEILPPTMADLFVENGFRTANNGTAWSAFPFIANYFAFNSYNYTTSFNTAIDYLRKGYFVIVSCGNGLFTTNGHYVVLVGINENTISIYDTYMYDGKFDIPSRKGKVSISGNTIYCSIENFRKYANYRAFWCYSNNDSSGNSSNSSSVNKYSTGTYKVTASVLRVRSGPGTNYRVMTRIKRGNTYVIDKISGIWGHLSNGAGWICLDYCNKLTTSGNPPKNYSLGIYVVATKSLPLRIRIGPGTNYRTVSKLAKGSRVTINKINGSWGHLSNNKGWIYLGYCRKANSKNYSSGLYRVTASALRVRTGPGTNYRIKTRVYRNTRQKIDYTRKNWGHLSDGAGWICLDYCKKI